MRYKCRIHLQQGLQELVDNATTEADRNSYQRELDRQEQIERNLYNS